MSSLSEALKNNFTIANLGAGGDFDYDLQPIFRESIILVEIDGADDSQGKAQYLKRYKLNKVVAGEPGLRKFRINEYTACSSVRPPNERLIKRYGLQDYYKINREEMVECVPLPKLLNEIGIDKVDFLKTDLEGEDFAVIKSMEGFADNILAIQAEVRFEPFYDGEPYFHEVIGYLKELGFELTGLRPEYWKPVTKNSHKFNDGKIVWADCLFLKKLDESKVDDKKYLGLAIAKQIVILSMLGRRGYAGHLAEEFGHLFDRDWSSEITRLTSPHGGLRKLKQRFIYPIIGKFRQLTQPSRYSRFKLEHVAKW